MGFATFRLRDWTREDTSSQRRTPAVPHSSLIPSMRDAPVCSRLAKVNAARYPERMSVLLNWNGKELPEELRDLPSGRYVLEPVDKIMDLTSEEEAGLEDAARSLDAEEGLSLDEVKRRLHGILDR